MLDIQKLQCSRENKEFGREIHYFREITSTNTHAKELARKGAAHGTVVIADSQTAGRGRMGKSFYSPAGSGMYLSIILRNAFAPKDMLAVTACAAAAVHSALEQFGITAQIKWVNDLFLGGRKICGILTEGGFSGEAMEFLILGIGLNIRKNPDVPAELESILTDLESETGLQIPADALLEAMLDTLEEAFAGLSERRFLSVYMKHSCTIGHRVLLVERHEEALAVGYTRDAGLIVRHDDGTEEVIRTGQARVMD